LDLVGKGWYIWQLRRCENGVASAIAAEAVAAGLSHVLIKVADGTNIYNLNPNTGADMVPPVVQALKNQNIQVWGWQYVYGYEPEGEAAIAIQRITGLGLDGFSIDAEGEYTLSGRDTAARTYMALLRQALPTFPIALSSYRYPTIHPNLPWQEFLEKCDCNMPQVYWVEAHNPAEQLARCVREFEAMTPLRPIIPTGSAYTQGDWTATPEDILEFLQAAQMLNLSAANFWEWGHTKLYVPELWETVKSYPWSYIPPQQDVLALYFDALNSHDAAQVSVLYADNAVHVDGDISVQGKEAIKAWYAKLFERLPGASFIMTGSSGDASSKSFTWTASSGAGSVLDGSDSIGIVSSKIVYHYTFFTIQ
jgi:hypothetical protein